MKRAMIGTALVLAGYLLCGGLALMGAFVFLRWFMGWIR